jgi:carboxymethylenebutenolidase
VGFILLLLATSGCTQSPSGATNATLLGQDQRDVVAEEVAYFHEGDAPGYLARLANHNSATLPGVVMVHEWWGLNDHVRDMARTLAANGYAVLAVDLFQGNVAATPEQARAQVQALDQDEALRNLVAATMHLRDAGAPRVSVLGWCFGGGQALRAALTGQPYAATVVYYGSLVTDEANLSGLQSPVLGIFGAEDRSIPRAQVEAFDRALTNLSIPHEVHVYPGVGHAFANPSGASYAPGPTQDAWSKTLAFLGRHAPPAR